MTELSESTLVWLRCKEVFGGQRVSRRLRRRGAVRSDTPTDAREQPFGPGREPHTTGAVLSELFSQFDWATPLAQARVIDAWGKLVGERVAAHARPLYVEEGRLLVQCDSTAWATQLRAIRSELVACILDAVPDSQIVDLKVLNPGAPSWRHGNRSVPGRGPRDTYG